MKVRDTLIDLRESPYLKVNKRILEEKLSRKAILIYLGLTYSIKTGQNTNTTLKKLSQRLDYAPRYLSDGIKELEAKGFVIKRGRTIDLI